MESWKEFPTPNVFLIFLCT